MFIFPLSPSYFFFLFHKSKVRLREDSGRCWQSLFKLSGIMEDYFVLRSWLMRQFSLSHPFLFLVVADTRGKQFVSHLIALEKLKNGNHKRPGLEGEERGERGTEERWGSDTIRPRLFGDPWYAV